MRTRGCCQVCCAEGKAGARVSPWPTRMWTRVGGQGRTRRTCGARVSPCPRHVDSRRPAGEDAEEVRRTRIAVTHGTWTCGCAQRLIARGSPSAAQRGNAANQTASRSSCRRESSDSMNVSLPMTRRGFWRSEWFFRGGSTRAHERPDTAAPSRNDSGGLAWRVADGRHEPCKRSRETQGQGEPS